MASFEDAWAAAAKPRGGETVSPELKPLLRDTYTLVLANPKNLSALKQSLRALLEYLAGPGRTNANCWAVDLFFMTGDNWESDSGAQDLPDDFVDVFATISGALHDTVSAPHIAENFDSLPEQILAQVNRLDITG